MPAVFAGSIVQAFRGWGGARGAPLPSDLSNIKCAPHNPPPLLVLCLGRSDADLGRTHRCSKFTEMV